MQSDSTKQPPIELGECPRNQWYAAEGKRLRAEGWKLRTEGEKWNLTCALIERRTAAANYEKHGHDAEGVRSSAWVGGDGECCADWTPGIKKLNGPILLAQARNPHLTATPEFHFKPFSFCPWCGRERPPTGADERPAPARKD